MATFNEKSKIERVVEWKKTKESTAVTKTKVVFDIGKLSDEEMHEYAMRSIVIMLQGKLRAESVKPVNGEMTFVVPRPNERRKAPEDTFETIKAMLAKDAEKRGVPVEVVLAEFLLKAGMGTDVPGEGEYSEGEYNEDEDER